MRFRVSADVCFPCESAKPFPNFHEQIVCIASKTLHPMRLKVRVNVSEMLNGTRVMLVRIGGGEKEKEREKCELDTSSTSLKLRTSHGRHLLDSNPGPRLIEPGA